jgi:hypothetical protein
VIDAEQITREQTAMESRRSNFEQLWQEVASLMLPRQADFLMSGTAFAGFSQGQSRTDRIYEETAMLSLDHGCAVVEGEVIPEGVQWQRLTARNEDLMDKRHVALWYERLTARVFALRNSPKSGFANQTHESVASLLSFGFQGMTTDHLLDAAGRKVGLRYMSEHIGQLYIREDASGGIETSHKKFRWHIARRWASKVGDQAPECALQGARGRGPARSSTTPRIYSPAVAHAARPLRSRPDRLSRQADRQRISVRRRQASVRYRRLPHAPADHLALREKPDGGLRALPAINVLPAVRARAGDQARPGDGDQVHGRPALGAHDDLLDQLIMYAPGGISYGRNQRPRQPADQEAVRDPDISAGVAVAHRDAEGDPALVL